MDKLTELAKELAELKAQRDELEAKLKPIKYQLDAKNEDSKAHEFVEYCRENDITGVKTGGYNVHFSTENRISLSDEEKAFDFFRMSGQGHIIREAIHATTLKSIVNQLVKDDSMDIGSAHEVGINIYPQTVVRVRKG